MRAIRVGPITMKIVATVSLGHLLALFILFITDGWRFRRHVLESWQWDAWHPPRPR
jgi:hypothetical protein